MKQVVITPKTRFMVLPLLPLRDVVVFPQMVVPLFVGRKKSISAIDTAMAGDRQILLCTQRTATQDDPGPEDIFRLGTVAEILQVLKLPDGTVKILVEGVFRAVIDEYFNDDTVLKVTAKHLKSRETSGKEAQALTRILLYHFEQYVHLNQKIPDETISYLKQIDSPARISDIVSGQLTIKQIEKQKLLECVDVKTRLQKLTEIVLNEFQILELEKKIRNEVRNQIEKNQKEYYLNEQMKAIQKELGKSNEDFNEIETLRSKVKSIKMPKDVSKKCLKEIKRLEKLSPISAESGVIRTYIDSLLEVPWNRKTKDKLNIEEAKKILEEDHYALKEPKDRILEYLSVRILTEKSRGPILCFVGPPGVGKTSLARSIARAMGKNFVRLSLGGVRDEAEIRGHRRTYVGALPGRIVQYLVKAKTRNPVFLLDEVDKMSMDFRGDPSAALLEVLDHEQNDAFNDHYLEVDVDLSEVFFITTANVTHPIPRPLQDRMEIIKLPGYTELEKCKIAENFLIPRLRSEHGLKNKKVTLTKNALLKIIHQYTREAGVRNLERSLSAIFRKVARKIVENHSPDHIKINEKNLHKYLGVAKYHYGQKEKEHRIGVATGLAWTEFGGDILQIEASIVPGKGQLTLTGKLGDVMQESAKAALSFARSRSNDLKVKMDFYKKNDIHIHVPEGAIPKDGPSAGITILTAFISALTGRPVRNDIAMTGEITLRGRVLPIGGLKEKLLAALRSGINEIILPEENRKDLEEIPPEILKKVKCHFVGAADDVLSIALHS